MVNVLILFFFFCKWMSSCFNITCCKDYLCFIVLPLLLCQNISWVYLCGFISGLITLFHGSLCLFFYPYHIVLNTVALKTKRLFLERGERREKEREGNIDWLPLTYPQPGTWPATQACALTRNWTSNLSDCRTMPNPLSHTSQG